MIYHWHFRLAIYLPLFPSRANLLVVQRNYLPGIELCEIIWTASRNGHPDIVPRTLIDSLVLKVGLVSRTTQILISGISYDVL